MALCWAAVDVVGSRQVALLKGEGLMATGTPSWKILTPRRICLPEASGGKSVGRKVDVVQCNAESTVSRVAHCEEPRKGKKVFFKVYGKWEINPASRHARPEDLKAIGEPVAWLLPIYFSMLVRFVKLVL